MSQKHFHEIAWIEPLKAAELLSGGHRLAFLDSASDSGGTSIWSYLAANPFGIFKVAGGAASWNGKVLKGDALTELRKVFEKYKTPPVTKGPPLQAGAIGVVHYEAASLFDDVPGIAEAPQIDLAFYDCVLGFNMAEKRLFVSGPAHEKFAWPDAKPAILKQAAVVRNWRDSRSRHAFEMDVMAVVEAIRDGDIFQANLSHQFSGFTQDVPDALATYKALRRANPAPFSALLVDGTNFVACTSPERFLRLDGKQIETRPIKGTIRRHTDPQIDAMQAERLQQSEKDRAENIMIVDLLRNDLSKVAVAESVTVEKLCVTESYARLHHLVSIVSAELEPGHDWLDLLAACFPGGSITGAPKLKAMEIIAKHEQAPRGVYCGSIGWIGFDGAMDLNIAIRTLTANGRDISLNAGGGITLMSNAAAEYAETLLKAEAVMSALGGSEGDYEIVPPQTRQVQFDQTARVAGK
jgi:para-aminobenzoate synthetase component I